MTLFPQSPAPPGCSATVTLVPFPEAGHLVSSWSLPFPNPHPRPLHAVVVTAGAVGPKACRELATSSLWVT